MKVRSASFLTIIITTLFTCTVVRDHPLDEKGERFVLPQIIIDSTTSSIYANREIHFDSGSVVISGNREECLFRLRKFGTDQPWSQWAEADTFNIEQLEEGKNTLLIECCYRGGEFIVDEKFDFYVVTQGYKPAFSRSEQQIIFTPVDSTVRLVSGATGAPPFQFQWLKRGLPINEKTGDTLIFEHFTAEDTGSYHCKVTNIYGSAVSSAFVVQIITSEIPSGKSVIYHENGADSGAIPVDWTLYEPGDFFTVLGNVNGLKKAGYTFAGWNLSANGDSTLWSAGSRVVMSFAEVHLYAVWTDKTVYSLTYDKNSADEGTVPTDRNSYLPQASVTVMDNIGNLAKKDSAFIGWVKSENAGEKVYRPGDTVIINNANLTLFAKWAVAEQSFRITYNKGATEAGNVPTDSGTYRTGDVIIVRENDSLSRTGYTFAGWKRGLHSVENKTYKGGDTLIVGISAVLLYPSWIANSYTIQFDSRGGTNVNEQRVAYGDFIAEPAAPAKPLNTFDAWYVDSAYSTKWIFTKDPVKKDLILYARWMAQQTYSVTYNSNSGTGGTVPADTNVYFPGATVTVSANSGSLVRTGFVFNGWNTNADGNGDTLTEASTFLLLDSNVMLYAQWLKRYTITYHLDGGTNSSNNPAFFVVTSNTIMLENPTKTGYGFEGWFSDSALTGSAVVSIPKGSSTNKDLYAKWTLDIVPAEINIDSVLHTYDGNPKPVTITTMPPGLSVKVHYEGKADIPFTSGTYAVFASITEPKYTGTASAVMTISRATPVIKTAPAASAITYGQALTSAVLSGGVTSVTGSFAFTTPVTVPPVGTGSYSVKFIPTDTINYKAVTIASITVSVAKAAPSVTTLPTAAAITFGQTLTSATLSGGVASVAGSFVFTTPSTAPSAGTGSYPVTFKPTDTTNYKSVTAGNVTITVAKATPSIITSPTAAGITFGQALSSATLSSGVASVAGSFAFTSPATVPVAGTGGYQVTFTPTDVSNYKAVVIGNVSVTVGKGTPIITTLPAAAGIALGQALSSATLSGGVASVAGKFSFAIPSTTPPVGTASHAVAFTPTDTANYRSVAAGNVSVIVSIPGPVVQLDNTSQPIQGFGITAAIMPSGKSLPWNELFSLQSSDALGLSILRIGMNESGGFRDVPSDYTKAKDLGAKIIGSCWSAPASWKTNTNVNQGGHLKPEYYTQWATRIADFANSYNLYAMSIASESDFASCGGSTPCNPPLTDQYPSMVYTASQMVDFVKIAGPIFEQRAPGVKMITPETREWVHIWSTASATQKASGYYDSSDPLACGCFSNGGVETGCAQECLEGDGYAYGRWLASDANAWNAFDILGTHQYGSQTAYPWPAEVTGGKRTKEVWQTEMSGIMYWPEQGPTAHIGNGLAVAEWIHSALTVGEASAWCYWWYEAYYQNDNEGLALLKGGTTKTKRYYALGNYSRFVRPGMTRVAVTGNIPDNVLLSAYRSTMGDSVVVVAINKNSAEANITIGFTGGTAPTSFTPWVTSASHSLGKMDDIAVTAGSFNAVLPAMSVTTFEGH